LSYTGGLVRQTWKEAITAVRSGKRTIALVLDIKTLVLDIKTLVLDIKSLVLDIKTLVLDIKTLVLDIKTLVLDIKTLVELKAMATCCSLVILWEVYR
jgi:hypothetical protein